MQVKWKIKSHTRCSEFASHGDKILVLGIVCSIKKDTDWLSITAGYSYAAETN